MVAQPECFTSPDTGCQDSQHQFAPVGIIKMSLKELECSFFCGQSYAIGEGMGMQGI